MKLVIVESPAKARTLSRILGQGYVVRASMGHVRDLPVSDFGVDVQRGFEPRYVTVRGKARTVRELQEQAERAQQVLLATDPDREGEAIGWHLAQLLHLPEDRPCRIEFHEVTPRAVRQAVESPRAIDRRLVEAQQARRILDRIVGYRLSPLLWRKVQRGLSAGRVQSVALRLVCEREDEIEAFVPREYWTVDGRFTPGRNGVAQDGFWARLVAVDGQPPDIGDEAAARTLEQELASAAYRVGSVSTQRRQRHPPAPFTTSTLQQEASRRLGFTARRTMAVAQQLYEGLELGDEGPVGLITYMRTDSVRVAAEAQQAARAFIALHLGRELVPPRPPQHRGPKGAQEAHEAIRPTSVERTPEMVRPYLNRDQWRLYELIWRRFVASQMAPARLHVVVVQIEGGRFTFRASGTTVEQPGFLTIWPPQRERAGSSGPAGDNEAGRRDMADGGRPQATSPDGTPAGPGADEDEEAVTATALPALAEGETLYLAELKSTQHFTQPPPRYNDASLVKTMEELGIGRPSTYAPTIETLLERRYCQREGRQLVPTPLGRAVVRLLKEQFPDVMDVAFTAQLEAQLDEVEAGRLPWREVVERFYGPFEQRVEQAMAQLGRISVQQEPTDECCPRCGRPMVIRWGRYGRFLACSGYPECRQTRPLLQRLEVRCPRCGRHLVERRTRRGRTFYGCEGYPECDYVLWQRPVGRPCPVCGRPLVSRRGRGGEAVVCSGQAEKGPDGRVACHYAEPSAAGGNSQLLPQAGRLAPSGDGGEDGESG